jgi:hypothetical protein
MWSQEAECLATTRIHSSAINVCGNKTMSTKVTMAFVAAVIALALPALAAGNRNRDNEHTYKLAQYCVPRLDEPPGTTRVFC